MLIIQQVKLLDCQVLLIGKHKSWEHSKCINAVCLLVCLSNLNACMLYSQTTDMFSQYKP